MRNRLSALIAVLLALATPPAGADEVVVGVEQGAAFDSIVDGFPMLALFDGVPDFPTGYNTLAIGLQLGITEVRGIGEFPIAALPANAVAGLRSATLVFNIDDVIGTFGPGTSFRGTASQRMLIHLYAGDGVVTIADHLEIGRPAHIVEPKGRITDQTLAQTGPLVFEVDVTGDVLAILAAAPVAVGVVFRTTDSPSATSLDNLGDHGAGPPGVNGSFLPYLRVDLDPEVAGTPTPTTTAMPATPTPIASAAPSAPSTCAGDCNGDGVVTIDEIVLGVAMGLGGGGDCAALDADGDGRVAIDELVRAVNAALGGC
ncbi:hypothetical protein KF840_18110 [bacterium]|nr:hypothetical protein [bacterium]